MVIGRSQHHRKQIKYWLNFGFAVSQQSGHGQLSDKAVIGLGIATLLPFHSRVNITIPWVAQARIRKALKQALSPMMASG